MITLHTFDNDYADGEIYHQFLQRDQQPLLESEALGAYESLGALLDGLADHTIVCRPINERLFKNGSPAARRRRAAK